MSRNLIVFDIDGTLTDTKEKDDELFIHAVRDIFKIEIKDTDWSRFENVTDPGIAKSIFKEHFGKEPLEQELVRLEDHFIDLTGKAMAEYPQAFREVAGAKDFFEELSGTDNMYVAIATGGWEATAKMKLEYIGINIKDFPMVTAADHENRIELLKNAISRAQKFYEINRFDRIIAIGDGIWDFKAAKALDAGFVGVDVRKSGKFKAYDIPLVIFDFNDNTTLLRYILS